MAEFTEEQKAAKDLSTEEPQPEVAQATVEDAAEAPEAEAKAETAEEPAEEESPFYRTSQKPQIIITRFRGSGKGRRRNSKLNTFVEKAKRLLRCNETITIHGIEDGIATTCTVVEILKREKIAVVKSLSSNVNQQQYFTERSSVYARSFMSLDFVLGRGELALYITDSKQRRLVDIFEGKDTDRTGALPKDVVEALDLAETFYSTEAQKAAAAEMLSKLGAEVSLPQFIKYASSLIDVNLRQGVFLQRAEEKYGPKPTSTRPTA